MTPKKTEDSAGHTINLDYVFVTPEGETFKDENGPMTVRKVLQACLMGDDPRAPSPGEEKFRAGELAYTKLRAKNPSFTAKDLELMSKKCEAACISPVWFQMKHILDGKADPLCE